MSGAAAERETTCGRCGRKGPERLVDPVSKLCRRPCWNRIRIGGTRKAPRAFERPAELR